MSFSDCIFEIVLLEKKFLLSAKTLISPLQGLVIYQELYFYQNYGTMCLRKAS